MQHISGLWGTSWIYISTFLEKLFKVILFLIIPIDSIKYLVSFFFFFETALKVQNTNTDPFYAASTRKVAR